MISFCPTISDGYKVFRNDVLLKDYKPDNSYTLGDIEFSKIMVKEASDFIECSAGIKLNKKDKKQLFDFYMFDTTHIETIDVLRSEIRNCEEKLIELKKQLQKTITKTLRKPNDRTI